MNSKIPEFNIGTESHVTINCIANQTIEINKLFGPLAALNVRVRLEYFGDRSDWVVEREKPIPNADGTWSDVEWVEVTRWDCQLDWPSENS